MTLIQSSLLPNVSTSVTHLVSALTSIYQLLNNSACWLLGRMLVGFHSQVKLTSPIVALPTGLLNINITPYLSHILLFCIADRFSSSGTHFIGTLDSSDCNNTLTPTHYVQTFTSWFSTTLKFTTAYPPSDLGLGALVSFFPKLGVVPGEECLPVPITMVTAVWHDKWAIQVLPFLAALSITAGAAGLTTSVVTDHQFSSQFTQELQPLSSRVKNTHWLPECYKIGENKIY